MSMKGMGVLFILGAILVLVLFAGQMLVSSGGRRGVSNEHLVEPADAPPTAAPQVPPRGDLRPDDVLTTEEWDLVHKKADYRYSTRHGDTIDELARKYLGDPDLGRALYEFNPHLVRGARLPEGSEILIPLRFRR